MTDPVNRPTQQSPIAIARAGASSRGSSFAGALGVVLLVSGLAACGSKSALVVGGEADSGPMVDGATDSGTRDSAMDTGSMACGSDAECDDGLFCTGVEACVMGRCASGTPVACVPPPDGCFVGECDEVLRECSFVPVDADGDRHLPEACGGDDCDDTDPTVFGGAPEICDYQDNDCNADVDEGLPYVGLNESLVLSGGFTGAVHPDVIFNGRDYHAVFDNNLGSDQVRHVSVDADGRTASPATQVTFSSALASSPDLTWVDGEMSLWHHYHLDTGMTGAVSVSTLGPDGSVVRRSVATTTATPDADRPAAAFNGEEWGVVYLTNLPSGAREVRYLQALSDGTVTVSPQVLVSSASIPFVKPAIAWTGTRFAVAWGDGPSLFIQGRDRSGRRAAWVRRQRSAGQAQAGLAFNGTELTVVWTSTTRIDTVHHARYADDGTLRGMVADVVPDPAQHTGVSLSSSPGELAVVYQATRTPRDGTFLVRFAPDLAWVSPPGAVDSFVSAIAGPAVAHSGREYGVAFPEDSPRTEVVRFRLAGCE